MYKFESIFFFLNHLNGEFGDVVASLLDSNIAVSTFESQSSYNVHIWNNTLGISINSLISPHKQWVK